VHFESLDASERRELRRRLAAGQQEAALVHRD
jgi:hypothetical protein